ncbi:MAG TPA: hypothetical protein DCW29_09490 [Janthinobacterium sp.]|nr:hypothetical protein [Janthinobacterium sp.]
MREFTTADRQADYLAPPSARHGLPDNHLARFIVDAVDRLDLGELPRQYGTRGSAAHHPAVLLSLLIYGYATGVTASRKIECASYASVAFRYIAANTHPYQDTLSGFRRQYGAQLERLFVDVLMLAREMGMLRLGNLGVADDRIKGGRRRPPAADSTLRMERQLLQEVRQLLALAEADDARDLAERADASREMARHQERLLALDEAKRKLDARARERDQATRTAGDGGAPRRA